MLKSIALGVFGLAVASIYLTGAASIRSSAFGDPVGSAGLPTILGWAMVAVSALLIVQALIFRPAPAAVAEAGTPQAAPSDAGGPSPEPDEAEANDNPLEQTPLRAWLRGAGVVGLSALYLIVLPHLGYIVSVTLLLAAVALYFGIARDWRLAVVSILGAVGMWIIFAVLLRIPVPAGVWPSLFG